MTATLPTSTTPITLTDAAAAKAAALLTEEEGDGLFLRVSVRPGGCSGMSYELFFDTESAADDLVATYPGVDVHVDAVSAPLLEGASLDYKDGLNDAGFHISNPSATRTCGCGSSFC